MFGFRRKNHWRRARHAIIGLVAAAFMAAWLLHPAEADTGTPDSDQARQDRDDQEDRQDREDREVREDREAAENRGPAVRQPVIPPGQEEALARMLGRGETLPGGCEFAHAHVERSVIGITYNCPSGEVAVEVRHPSDAPSGATQTAQFAVVLRGGEAPKEFFPGLLSQIRSGEGAVAWEWTAPSPGGTGRAQVRRGYSRIVTLATIGAIVAAAWWLRRRAGQAARAE